MTYFGSYPSSLFFQKILWAILANLNVAFWDAGEENGENPEWHLSRLYLEMRQGFQ
jgi:hypothetical protein